MQICTFESFRVVRVTLATLRVILTTLRDSQLA
jgi:hypothetical protein